MSDSELLEGGSSLDAVKTEITFFMEKTFQISFGYLGALVALGAAAKLSVGSAIAKDVGIPGTCLACAVLLAINMVYLSLAAGTLFATLKRGLYVILSDKENGGHRQWELYLRRSSQAPFGGGMLSFMAWNVDNYYMVPLFTLIVVISVAATIIGLAHSTNVGSAVIVGTAAVTHVVPGAMLLVTAKVAEKADAMVDRSAAPSGG